MLLRHGIRICDARRVSPRAAVLPGRRPGSSGRCRRRPLAARGGDLPLRHGSFDRAARQFTALAAEAAPGIRRDGPSLRRASLYRLERLDEAAAQFGESARLLRLTARRRPRFRSGGWGGRPCVSAGTSRRGTLSLPRMSSLRMHAPPRRSTARGERDDAL